MSKGWDNRIPYRLGTDHYCTYEEDGSYVRMGDMVTWFDYTWICGTYEEFEHSGELCSVRYDGDGFIDMATVYEEGEERDFDYPCDGVFHLMKECEHES